jgi:hypothetical protein
MGQKKGNVVKGSVKGAIEQGMQWIMEVKDELDESVGNMSGTAAESTELCSNMESAASDLEFDEPEMDEVIENLEFEYFVPTRQMSKMERLSEASSLLRSAVSVIETAQGHAMQVVTDTLEKDSTDDEGDGPDYDAAIQAIEEIADVVEGVSWN